MTHDPTQPEPDPDVASEQLVGYLDGELDPESSRDLERRLADDPELRERLQAHQQAWELLEAIPRTEVDETFVRTTVEMVAVSASDDVRQLQRQTERRRLGAWALCGAGVLLTAAVGYFVTGWMLAAPNRRLSRDLPIIENLDAYRDAGSVEFLRALEREGLFTEEAEDAL